MGFAQYLDEYGKSMTMMGGIFMPSLLLDVLHKKTREKLCKMTKTIMRADFLLKSVP